MTSPARPFLTVTQKKDSPVALVAGGAGFVGSFLCEALLAQNCKVICLDNLETGKKENLKNCFPQTNFTFLEHDINQVLPDLLSQIDYIFHLAGTEEYLSARDLSLATLLVNSQGTQNLLDLALKEKAKFLLVSSLEVYVGALSPSTLKQNGLEDFNSGAYSHHEAKRFAEALTQEYFRKYNLDCRVVRIADVYGPRMDLATTDQMRRLIKEALEEEILTIEGEGLKTLYPTFVSDLVSGLVKAMFSEGTKGKIYNLIAPRQITLLNLANLLQELKKYLKIVFVAGKTDWKFPLPLTTLVKTQEELGWKPKEEVMVGLRETLNWFEKDKKKPQEEETRLVEAQEGSKVPLPFLRFSFFSSSKILIILFFLFLLVLFFSPAALASWHTIHGIKDLKAVQTLVFSSRIELALTASKRAERHFILGERNLEKFNWLFRLLKKEDKKEFWENNLEIAQEISRGAKHLLLAGQEGSSLSLVILGKEEGNIGEKIEKIKEELEEGEKSLALAEAELKNINMEKTKFGEIEFLKNLPQYRKSLSWGQDLISLLPEIIGSGGRQTYLLLLQNNMELRPTGGFIGSYGLLTFENSRLLEFKIEDIYTADGQLKGHVEPPEPIKKFLGKEHWFLRDSNWDPSFPQSAQKAEWFLEKAIGVKVDGVVALDLNLAQNLLAAVGQVTLPDYQETITAQNLFEKAEKYSEIDFFPGSTAKKDFLGSLARRLIDKLTTEKNIKWWPVAEGLRKALEEKHLLVYFNNPLPQKLIKEYNWDGAILAEDGDYLFLNEANLGVNKANFFLKRKITSEVTIGKEGEIDHQVFVDYENTSLADTWPAGVYKNYLRLFTPPGTTFKGLEINGVREDYQVATESGKTVVSLYFEVPIKSQTRLRLVYRSPEKLSFKDGRGVYEFLIQKQAGIGTDPLTVTIDFPVFLRVDQASPGSLTSPQLLRYNTDLSSDRKFKVEFLK